MPKPLPNPTEGELAILRVLWSRSAPMTVREVHAELSLGKSTAYTTVLKMLTIMADKGLVDRDDTVRPQIYRPRQSEDRTQKQLLTDLIQRVYGGSVKALVLHAIGTRKPTAEDLDAIEKLLDRFEGGEK